MNEIINIELVDFLRLNPSIITWKFDNDENDKNVEIIPINLTHDYIFDTFKVDEYVYKYYFLPSKNLISDIEFEDWKSTGYIGSKETALRPYFLKIYGAYHLRSDLDFKLRSLLNPPKEKKLKGKVVGKISDLKPYFKEYAEGFEKGFKEFEEINIKPHLLMLADKKDFIIKVYEFVTKQIFLKNWAFSVTGFTVRNPSNEIIECFENGLKHGYYYKAWSIILANSQDFATLFKERLETKTHQKPKLKIDQIALKYVYEGLQVTRKNGNDIAKEYGHNSGEKLFQKFTYYSSSTNRKGNPKLCTPKTLDNKIKLIESVIELLPIDKQDRAKDEFSILKATYEAEYQ